MASAAAGLIQYVLQDNEGYSSPQIFVDDEIVQSAIFSQLTVDLSIIFGTEES